MFTSVNPLKTNHSYFKKYPILVLVFADFVRLQAKSITGNPLSHFWLCCFITVALNAVVKLMNFSLAYFELLRTSIAQLQCDRCLVMFNLQILNHLSTYQAVQCLVLFMDLH